MLHLPETQSSQIGQKSGLPVSDFATPANLPAGRIGKRNTGATNKAVGHYAAKRGEVHHRRWARKEREMTGTIGDALWIWGQEAGCFHRYANNAWRLPGMSRMTPAEGAYYMGIPN